MFLITLAGLLGLIFVLASFAAKKYTTTKPPSKPGAPLESRNGLPTLSIVVPCYNEELRLGPMLRAAAEFCTSHIEAKDATFGDFEVLVVDDCSSDDTVGVAESFFATEPKVKGRVVRVNPNHGKGYAVRTGFFEAIGDFVLMADGDNATNIADVAKLFRAVATDAAKRDSVRVAVGSRAHLEKDSIAKRTFFRTVLMKGFHLVVAVTYCVCTLRLCHLHDTQCGFKLFERKPAMKVFRSNRLERWAFDVELLVHCRNGGLGVVEVPVRWQEIPGSKVRLGGMAQMGLECALMCVAYPLKLWSLE